MSELFLELRMDELPASMVRPALEGLANGLRALIDGVPHGAVRTFATPRRLAVAISDVAPARAAVEREVTGPGADKSFDADGNPTAVGIAFAKGKGADPADLRVVEIPKRGKVVAVTLREGGERVVDLLRDGVAKLITGIPFAKSMVWGDGTLFFGRPLQGIVVVYDGAPVSGEAHGIAFSATSQGHRMSPDPFVVTSCDQWIEGMRARHVEPDLDARKARIASQREEAEKHLSEARATLEAAGLKNVQTAVLEGLPGERIVEEAQSRKTDVVVMSTHGRSGFRRAVLGSVADHVLRTLDGVPLLLVRPNAE